MSNTTVHDLFPSRFLKSQDIGDSDLVLTIDRVVVEPLGFGEVQEKKPVVYFVETDKGLVLNKTNAFTIANLNGEDYSSWTGNRISLYSTEVSFQGTTMMGIRIRMRTPGQGPGSSQVEAESSELWE